MDRKNFKIYLLAAIVGSSIIYELNHDGYFLGWIPTMIFWGIILFAANLISTKLYPDKSDKLDDQSSSDLPITNKSEESISEMFLKNMEQKSNTTTENFPLENNLSSASNIPDTNKTNDLHKSNIIILILSFIAIIAIASNLIVYAYDEGYSSGYTKGRADGSNAAQVESDNTDDYTKSEDTDSTPVSDKPAKSDKKQQNMVWVNGTGKKYHKRSDCSNMNSAYLVTQEEAEDMGKDPCKKCY